MSSERIKGKIAFTCDGIHCHEAIETEHHDFGIALASIKDDGWIVKRIGAAYQHFCSKVCASP
jgi:hypothetical protein